MLTAVKYYALYLGKQRRSSYGKSTMRAISAAALIVVGGRRLLLLACHELIFVPTLHNYSLHLLVNTALSLALL